MEMMPVEIRVLAYAGLLQFVQIILYAIPANLQLGPAYTAGPRDEPRQPQGLAGRLQRAVNNHFEGLILFAIAVVVVVLGNGSSALTQNAAWAYLASRILYVPAYVSGVFMLRSVVWAVGFCATLTMLLATLL